MDFSLVVEDEVDDVAGVVGAEGPSSDGAGGVVLVVGSAAPQSALDATADVDPSQTTPTASRLTTPEAGRLAALDLRWLRYAPLTRTGVISVGVLYGLVTQFRDDPNLELIAATFAWVAAMPIWLAAAALLAGAVLLAIAVSVAGYLCLYWRYRLTREPDGTIQVEQGLFTTRSVAIDANRIRGAAVMEPLLLRVAGGARAAVVTTGIATTGSDLLLPPAPIAEAHRVCGTILGPRTADMGPSSLELAGWGRRLMGHCVGIRARRCGAKCWRAPGRCCW